MSQQDLLNAYNKVRNSDDFKKKIPGHSAYVGLDGFRSTLDGDFSADDLRAIAALMDKLAATPEFQAYDASRVAARAR